MEKIFLSWGIYIALHASFCLPAVIYRRKNYKAINSEKAQTYGIICFFITLLLSLVLSMLLPINLAVFSGLFCLAVSVISYIILHCGYDIDPVAIYDDLINASNKTRKQFIKNAKRTDNILRHSGVGNSTADRKKDHEAIRELDAIIRKTDSLYVKIIEYYLFVSHIVIKQSCNDDLIFYKKPSAPNPVLLRKSFYDDLKRIKCEYDDVCDEIRLLINTDHLTGIIHSDCTKLNETQKKQVLDYICSLHSEEVSV